MKWIPLLLLLVAAPAHSQWTQWRGDNANAIVEHFAAPAAWPETAQTLWRVEIGSGDGSPIAANGRVYTHSRQGSEEVVTALDLASGAVIWQDRYGPIEYTVIWPGADARGKGPFSTPTLTDGRLFTYGMQQTLSAYRADSGALLWREAFDQTLDFGTSASPVVIGDQCIVHVGIPKEGALKALDVATGAVRWEVAYDGPSYATPFLTTVHGVEQLIVLSAKYLAGIIPATGEILWQTDVPHPWNENISMPVQVGDLFVVSAVEQGIKGLRISRNGDAWTATEAWHNTKLFTYTSSPVVKDGVVYGFAHRRKGQFFALDPNSGAVSWQSPGRQGENASLLLADDLIIALDDDGELSAFEARPDSFVHIASSQVAPTATWAHPNAFGDSLLVKDIGTVALVRLTGAAESAISAAVPSVAPHEIATITWEQDGAEMALIPAGPFAMGSRNGDLDERPVRQVHVDAFYIDRYEVTNAQYRRFVEATGHRHPQAWTSPDYNRPEQPVVSVNWRDAMAYAAWAGKRLPTEAEWEKAARGGLAGRLYPWGDEPPVADSTYRANFEFMGPVVLPDFKQTYPVGTFAPNRYGLYDMAGNVWEWTLEPYVEDAYASLSDRNPVAGGQTIAALIAGAYKTDRMPVFRGGSYQDYDNLLRVANRNHRPLDWDSSSIGFRTVAVPK